MTNETKEKLKAKIKSAANKLEEVIDKLEQDGIKKVLTDPIKDAAQKVKEVVQDKVIDNVKAKVEDASQKVKAVVEKLEQKGVTKVLTHTITTHFYALVAGALMMYGMVNNAEHNRFKDNEDDALYKLHAEYTEHTTGKVVKAENFNADSLNRAYFDPNSFPRINWVNDSNQKVGKVFGKISAKEMAVAIDAINHNLTTPGKKYNLDYNYCHKAVTTAYEDAIKRSNMKTKGKMDIFDDEAKQAGVLYNGDTFVSYHKRKYGQVPGAIIENPTAEDFARISEGSLVRFGGHSKMFIGIGFVDSDNKVFVPDANGKPVIASGYDESFKYFDGDDCTVVDMSKIVYYKLENEAKRHTR
ncbi:MAG: hypothetical protein IJL05_04270 [Alphaproteobacteria bacterium]|nr:hypothetical protein [Alphaproteobacteria bacterium]